METELYNDTDDASHSNPTEYADMGVGDGELDVDADITQLERDAEAAAEAAIQTGQSEYEGYDNTDMYGDATEEGEHYVDPEDPTYDSQVNAEQNTDFDASEHTATSTTTNTHTHHADVWDVACAITVYPEQFTHTDTFPSSLSLSALRASLAKSFRTTTSRVQVVVRGLDVGSDNATTGSATGSGSGNGSGNDDGDSNSSVSGSAGGVGVSVGADVMQWCLGDVAAALRSNGHADAGTIAQPLHLDMYTHDDVGAEEEQELASQPPVDVLRVTVQGEDGGEGAVVFVRIVKEFVTRPKAYLGGWRNKRNGKVFHHACTQTKKKNKATATIKCHRATQTVKTESRSIQSHREAATQTILEKPDIGTTACSHHDRYLTPRPYITADEVLLQREQHAREVQGYLRVCFAHRRIRRLQIEREERAKAEAERLEQLEERRKMELMKETNRRMHPISKADFAVLEDELAAWKAHQLQKIKESGLPQDEQQFLVQQVLGKELAVTQITERLRQEALRKRRDALVDSKLARMCGGHAWSGGGGTVIVDTPHTVRARELVTVYKGLQADLSTAERLDVLSAAKALASEFNSALTRELVQLAEREEDLLHRGRSKESLSGLRKRIGQLFLDFLNSPEYNPQAAMFTAE